MQTTMTNRSSASEDNSLENSFAFYVYHNKDWFIDPDVRVNCETSTRVSFVLTI